MTEPLKIIFVLPSLRAGGAERVMSFIAQNIDKTKFEASLLIIGHEKNKKFDVEGIAVTYLNYSRVRNSFFSVMRYLKRVRPDVVVGSIGHINMLLALLSVFIRKPKYIGREANVKSVRRTLNENKRNTFLSFLHTRSFRLLDVVICQSKDMFDDLKALHKIDESRFITIPNPITDGFHLKSKSNKDEIIKYITVGTLHKRKGHLRLLQVLSQVDHDFQYTIIGSGSTLEEITKFAEDHKINDKIEHIAFTNDVANHLAASDVFLNGSFVEGFPNVLIESCAVGTPVVAFDAPGGINEIIIEGTNGHIVGTEQDFIDRLNTINAHYNFDNVIIRESVYSKYSKSIILNIYEDLFINLVSGKPIK